MDGPFLADTYTLLPDAALIARQLVLEADCPFPFAKDVPIVYLLQQPQLFLRGEPCDAYIAVPKVQGSNRLLWDFLVARFTDPKDRHQPDFLVYVDAAAWSLRGRSDEHGRSGFPLPQEALIYHELCHLRHLQKDGAPRFHEDGRPMLALQRHTYEFFDLELRRYGPLTLGLDQVGSTFVAGAQAEKTRRRRGTLRLA